MRWFYYQQNEAGEMGGEGAGLTTPASPKNWMGKRSDRAIALIP